MQIEIKTQFMVDSKRPIHMGEILMEKVRMGAIGWIDWCNEPESRAGVFTAKLEIIGSKFEIYVKQGSRTPDLNIGEDLFYHLVYRLRSLGYEDLIIIGAINFALPFYHHVFDALLNSKIIESYSVIESKNRNTVDNHDFRLTFRPKPVFLPG